MLLPLSQAKASSLADIAGACVNSAQFLTLLNDGTRMLMNRGNWFGTVQKLRGCVYNNCITWGPRVGTVLAFNACNRHIPVMNNWAEFIPMDSADYCLASRCRYTNAVVNDGTTPVFNQIECAEGRFIRVYPTLPSDVGKTVTLFGIDTNGQTVRSERDDGTFQDGVEVTIAIPFGVTTIQFRRVTRVLKEVTDGPIRLYQFDSTNNVMQDMAYYEAWETAPNYRHTHLNANRRGICYGCNDGLQQITALVKLEFVPVVNDDDVVLIENLEALKLAMQAVKMGDAYSMEQREAAILLAVRALNLELNNRFPLNQTPVSINPFGSARPSRAGIGQIV